LHVRNNLGQAAMPVGGDNSLHGSVDAIHPEIEGRS
jgi:hypothetical protein